MKLKKLILTFFFLITISAKADILIDSFDQVTIDRCQEEILEAFIEGLNDQEKQLFAKLLNITTLKLASLTTSYDKQNLEEALVRYQEDLKNFQASDIEKFKNKMNETYSKELPNHSELIEQIMEKNNFRRPNTRLSNTDLFHFVALYRHQNPNGEFQAHDEAILWLSEKISSGLAENYGKYSLPHNYAEHSNRVVTLLDNRSASFSDLREKLKNLENQLIQDLQDIQEKFKQQSPYCYDEAGKFLGICSDNHDFLTNILSEAVIKSLNEVDQLRATAQNGQLEIQMNETNWSFIPLDKIIERQDFERFTPSPSMTFENLANFHYRDRSYINYRIKRDYQFSLNGLPQAERIQEYMKDFYQENPNNLSNYAIIDKIGKTLSVFGPNGDLVQGLTIDVPNISDQSRHGGVGEWIYVGGSGEIILSNKSSHHLAFSITSVDKQIELRPMDRVIIMPSDVANEVLVRDGKLVVETTKRFATVRERQDLNEGPRTHTPQRTFFVITDPSVRSDVAVGFVQALTQEKETLMKLYNLSNEEYNELARLSFGILGNESQFGTSYRYRVKESVPLVVSIAKGEWFNTSSNSRGPTQIKTVPAKIENHYGVTKANLGDPKNAAVSTIGFLAEALQELRSKERRHPGITPINRYDYLHYIYTGRTVEINQGTGTPERNIYYRNLINHTKKLAILEEV